MTALLAIVVPALFIFAVAVVVSRIKYRMPSDPRFEEVATNDERVPPAVRCFWSQVGTELDVLGFEPAAYLTNPRIMADTELHMALYENRLAGDGVVAIAVIARASSGMTIRNYSVEFSTELAGGVEIGTFNSPSPPLWDDPDWKMTCRMPRMADLGVLYRVHQSMLFRHADRREPRLPKPGEYVDSIRASLVRELDAQVRTGFLCLSRDRMTYRLTWKGAVLGAWRQLWPMSAIGRWRARRQARVLLAELGLVTNYRTVDYRRLETALATPRQWPAGEVHQPGVALSPPRKGLAIAALVCGIVGLVPMCLPAQLLGIVLGIVAWHRARREPSRYGGAGLAIGGLCTGAIGLMLFSLMVALMFGPFGFAEQFRRNVCEVNLEDIDEAIATYAADHDDALPPDFETLVAEGLLGNVDFECLGADLESEGLYACYQYVPGQTTADDPDNVVIYEKPECHNHEGGTVLRLDGRVEFVVPYSRLELLLAETRRRLDARRDAPSQ